jgi:6-phospho-3-hexuloisomerase
MSEKSPQIDLIEIVRDSLTAVDGLLGDMDGAAAARFVRLLLNAGRIFITGKGRSGFVAECFATRLMQMGFDVHVPGEATCPRITEGDLMVAVSCSGNTSTTVQLARISHTSRATVVAVSAVAGSRLAALADLVVLVPTTQRKVKQRYAPVLGPHNNTLFEEALLLYFDSLVYAILEQEGIPDSLLRQRHTNLE